MIYLIWNIKVLKGEEANKHWEAHIDFVDWGKTNRLFKKFKNWEELKQEE